ncbi:ABC transporter substrate-binding protein [Paenibacillus sp.]|uniref:ABC transporter substrate-binding protein n=1 Tax=Paenibacillus sp. TaxID=58172 RepID=UPI0035615FD0
MKKRLTAMMTVMLAILLTACSGGSAVTTQNSESPSSPGASTAAAGESKDPIIVGALLSQSGPQAQPGESAKKGIELYFSQHNYMIGDRKVEIKYEDDEGNPQTGLRKYRQLINSSKADVVLGPLLSNVVYALTDEVQKVKKPMIIVTAAANDISWSKKSDYMIRTSLSNWQSGTPGGKYFADKVGKTAYIVASDYPAGHEVAAGFKEAFIQAGGKVIEEAYPPLGANDYATNLNQIKQAKPELVFAFMPGADGIRFIKQYKEFGLKGNIPLTSSGEFGDVLITEPTGADSEGIYSTFHYYPALENETNKKFVEEFKAKYGKIPDFYSVYGYDAAQAFAEAVKKTGGSVKSDDLLKALKGITINSPRGSITIDPQTNNPIQTFYAGRNVMKDGSIVFEPLANLGEMVMPEKDPAAK